MSVFSTVEAVEERLGRSVAPATREVLDRHGNMSSPSVLFALQRHLGSPAGRASGDTLWLTSFGAGFTVHGMNLRRTPQQRQGK
ncbi:MAG: 3-oxoacyl-[acyl-carrier-protein] synthase III C-terminal domain-containing protein [Oceanipulchritudo sp.]